MLWDACSPLLLSLALYAVAMAYALRFVCRMARIPNYATSSPSGILSWSRLAPADILFRLASLAALNVVLYWLPIYYWTTYEPSGDERDGDVLFFSMVVCPITWILGVFCYGQAWRNRETFHHSTPIRVTASLLLLTVLSTLIPQVKFYVWESRF